MSKIYRKLMLSVLMWAAVVLFALTITFASFLVDNSRFIRGYKLNRGRVHLRKGYRFVISKQDACAGGTHSAVSAFFPSTSTWSGDPPII